MISFNKNAYNQKLDNKLVENLRIFQRAQGEPSAAIHKIYQVTLRSKFLNKNKMLVYLRIDKLKFSRHGKKYHALDLTNSALVRSFQQQMTLLLIYYIH